MTQAPRRGSVLGVVLAAGLGTRLEPLTRYRPKPAIPVANRPMAWFAMSSLTRAGAARIAVNTFHLQDGLKTALTHASKGLAPVSYSEESTLLGTAGGLRQATERLSCGGLDSVLVMNGDILYDPPWAQAMRVHEASGASVTLFAQVSDTPAGQAMAVAPGEGALPWVLRRVHGEPAQDADLGLKPVMFTGCSIWGWAALRRLPKTGCLARDVLRLWALDGERVAVVLDDRPFRDLGTLEGYLEANIAFARGEWSRAALGPAVDPTANVAGTTSQSVVGARARVGRAVQSVVWDGCQALDGVEGGIVTEGGVVPVPGWPR